MKRSALTQLPNALRMAPTGDAVGGAALPGYSALPNTFTLNSVTPTPTFIFRGRDLSGATWPELSAAVTLVVAGTGTAPASSASPFPNPADTAVTFTAGGQRFEAPTNAFGDVLTNDFVIEYIAFLPTSTTAIVSKKNNSASGTAGWRAGQIIGPVRVNLFMRDGVAANTTAQNAGTLFDPPAWVHIIMFADRSGDVRIYRNGVLILATSVATTNGSLAGTDILTLGAFGLAAANDSVIAYTGLWQAANLCSGATADQDALASARFALTGLPP